MRYLVDTSVILRLRSVQDPNHVACLDLIDEFRVPRCDAVVCGQVLIEYWAVATRPVAVNGFGLLPAEVAKDLQDFESSLGLLPEPSDVFDYWRRLVKKFDVRGRPTHDARLVALMDAYGINGLISLNTRDFARYPHIIAITPQDWLAAHPRQVAP